MSVCRWGVRAFLCASMHFVCVCVYGCMLRSAGLEWGAAAAFGSLWLSVKQGRPCGALLGGPDNASAGLSTPGQSV